MKRLIFDLDGTICIAKNGDYSRAKPYAKVIKLIREYKSNGFEIIISTSRNIRTYDGNLGKINANTLPVIIKWLDENQVPYDEIYIGKHWCGLEGFYIDDKAIRPSEFLGMSYEEIIKLLHLDSLNVDKKQTRKC